MKMPKMQKSFIDKCPPLRNNPKNPAHRGKIGTQKPQSGGKFSVQISKGARGDGYEKNL